MLLCIVEAGLRQGDSRTGQVGICCANTIITIIMPKQPGKRGSTLASRSFLLLRILWKNWKNIKGDPQGKCFVEDFTTLPMFATLRVGKTLMGDHLLTWSPGICTSRTRHEAVEKRATDQPPCWNPKLLDFEGPKSNLDTWVPHGPSTCHRPGPNPIWGTYVKHEPLGYIYIYIHR